MHIHFIIQIKKKWFDFLFQGAWIDSWYLVLVNLKKKPVIDFTTYNIRADLGKCHKKPYQ